MNHEYDIDHRTGAWPRRDAPPAASSVASTGALPAGALTPGWICLQDCDLSGVPGHAVPLQFVLLHADLGVALLDIAPAATQGAESTLRRRLETARFEGIFPGYLPVVQLRIAADEVGELGALLDQAFATLPPLSVAGGDAWISVVRRALSPRDPARGATYRGVYPDDWPASPQSAMQMASGQPPPDPVSDGTRMADGLPYGASPHGAMPGGAPRGEAAVTGNPPRRRRRPLVWAALGIGGLAAIAAVVMAGGRSATEAPPQLAQPQRPAPSAVAPAIRATELAPPRFEPPAPLPAPAPTGSPAGARPSALAGGNAAPRPAEAPIAPRPELPAAPRLEIPAAPRPEMPAPPWPDQVARVVVTSGVNLRTGPDRSFAVLRIAPRGENFRVHDRAPGNWFQVGQAKPEGWVFGDMVREVRQ